MDKNYDDKLLIIQPTVEANSQETDEKQMKTYEKITIIT